MGRLSKSRALSIWMNGERVGEWRRPAGGGQELIYAESWLSSPASRPISLSFPLRPSQEPYRTGVGAFFENLLPDNRRIRERIQRRFRTDSADAFDLLQEIGRDCVGALQLLPGDAEPQEMKKITAEKLTPDGVSQVLAASLGPGFGPEEKTDDSYRISLAGAQEKTALLWHKGAWQKPTGATPTTHIFKLPMGVSPHGIDLSTSVENEWLCAQIVRGFGIPVAPCQMATFGDYKTLIVERFDRKLAPDEAWWLRLPQEDFCQATATPPALKYENEGGPGIRKIMELLRGSQRAEEDRRDFMRTQLVFWLLAATDGHAKNFSLFLQSGGAFQLTPRYDILSAYPMLGRDPGKLAPQKITMAMALEGKNRHYHWERIKARHWIETARRCGVSDMNEILDDVVARVPTILERVNAQLPASFPASLWLPIFEGIGRASERLCSD